MEVKFFVADHWN
jgi:molybdate-binding protein